MHAINIHDAKTRFSKLVEAVIGGEEVVIAKAGKPVARLVPFAVKKERKWGILKGKIHISEDFDAPLPNEILDQFEGK